MAWENAGMPQTIGWRVTLKRTSKSAEYSVWTQTREKLCIGNTKWTLTAIRLTYSDKTIVNYSSIRAKLRCPSQIINYPKQHCLPKVAFGQKTGEALRFKQQMNNRSHSPNPLEQSHSRGFTDWRKIEMPRAYWCVSKTTVTSKCNEFPTHTASSKTGLSCSGLFS